VVEQIKRSLEIIVSQLDESTDVSSQIALNSSFLFDMCLRMKWENFSFETLQKRNEDSRHYGSYEQIC
jgi:hypothetical protein